jgi:hypothetical protein
MKKPTSGQGKKNICTNFYFNHISKLRKSEEKYKLKWYRISNEITIKAIYFEKKKHLTCWKTKQKEINKKQVFCKRKIL